MRIAAALVCLAAGAARPARAQIIERLDTLASRIDSMLPRPDTLSRRTVRGVELAPGSVRCNGERISELRFFARAPGFTGRSAASRIANWPIKTFHSTTKWAALEPYLQLAVGEPCREVARQESERVIRQLWYVQDVQVAAFRNPDGTVRIEVRSVDEFQVMFNPHMNGASLTGARVGWNNVGGLGILAEVGQRDFDPLRRGYSFRLRTSTFMGQPLQTSVAYRREGLGEAWQAELRFPFLTDLQRYAFRAVVGADDDYVRYRRAQDPEPFQPATRAYAAVGGLRRFGGFGNAFLVGASITHDDEEIGDAIFVDSVLGSRPFPEALPSPAAPPRAVTRANALLGARALRFLPVEGFDALTGTQDLRIGTQVSAQLGRGLVSRDALSDAFFLAGNAFFGWGTPSFYAATDWIWSGRHDGQDWDGRVASSRSAVYWKPHRRMLTTLDVQFVGAERMRVPFQLPLGGGATGLVAYRRSREGGESRLRARLEQRQFAGRPFGLLDLGISAFAETGRLWAGDAPYGVTTGWRNAVGIAVLGAVPPRSRQLLRLEVAWRLSPDRWSSPVELRATSGNLTRFFWRDPGEASRGRERSLFADLFNF
jgi:hypothetical protein